MDRMIEFGLSNTLIAGMLAGLAWGAWQISRGSRRAQLSHLLWLMAFLKLLTPPLMTFPLFSVEETPVAIPIPLKHMDDAVTPEILAKPSIQQITPGASESEALSERLTAIYLAFKTPVIWLWGSGALLVLIVSLIRVIRFNRVIQKNMVPATDKLRRQARQIAGDLELKSIPKLVMTSADISPMVWCLRRTYIVMPARMVSALTDQQRYWVLAHELAHVKRA